MVTVRLAGGEVAFDVRGRGVPVLLLHAFPLSRAMWDPQVEALADRCQLVRFDVRGFGDSPPSGGIVTMERTADDAAGLLDHLGLSRAVLCGLSMGASAALAFARRYPERLLGLALADARAADDDPMARAERSRLGERIRLEGSRAAADAMLPVLLGATSRRERPDLVARVRALIEANPPSGLCDGLAGLAARADSRPTLRAIGVPAPVVSGDEDELTPVDEARRIAAAIPGARLEVVPGAGHLPNLENPAAFDAALAGLVDRVG